ncbi:hypothetical protein K439DRAFT_1663031 [Ramaria rubella]|nr:hypothetical protein K439DRAFT_1663031 [Ramaria rubella]
MSGVDSKYGVAPPSRTPSPTDDSTDDVVPQEQPEDSCTPLPEDATKRSKKRLREVSVEASNVKEDHNIAPENTGAAEVPQKKNRLKSLEPADLEVAQPPSPTTPPTADAPLLSASPPYDTKVRQIRRRVKDLSWQGAQPERFDEGSAGEVDRDEGPEAADVGSDEKAEDDDSSKSVSAKSDSDKEDLRRTGGEELLTTGIMTDTPPKDTPSSRVPPTPSSVPPAEDHSPIITEKHPETGVAGPSVSRVSPDPDACQGKRRREDGDQNPREMKRISPPPEKEESQTKAQPVKSTGFMAYASSASPFGASKNVPNVFGSTKPAPIFGSSSLSSPSASSSYISSTAQFSTPATFTTAASAAITFGASGFNAYASSASPFATAKPSGASPFGMTSASVSKSPSRAARSKSPGRHANAFGPYTTRSGKFAATPRPPKKQKRGSSVNGLDADVGAGSGSASGSGDEAGDDDPGSPTTFGDILSAKENRPDFDEDDDKRVEYTEREVTTGEEEERTEHQVRAKLFALEDGLWKERGVGTLKLNVHKKTGRARMVLRTDGVLRLVLNTSLFKGMNFAIAQDPRYVKFGLIVDKKIQLHTLRLGSTKNAEDLLEQVKAHTPGLSVTDAEEV